MLNRIITIKNIGRFEQLKAANGNEGDFARINVIYARNASGKTTLCDVFRSAGTNEPAYVMGRKRIGAPEGPSIKWRFDGNNILEFCNGRWSGTGTRPRIYVYDQRFVRDNVFVGAQIDSSQRHNVYSLALGEKAISLNRKVDEAGRRLGKATETVSRFEAQLLSLVPVGYQIETFRTLDPIDNADSMIEELMRQISEETIKKSKAEKIRQHGILHKIAMPSVSIDNLDSVLSSTLDDAALTAEKEIKKHLSQFGTNTLSTEWIKQGAEAQHGDVCPYCGQNMAGTDLFVAYKAFFSGAMKQQEHQRDKVRNVFLSALGNNAQSLLTHTVADNMKDVAWWNDACGLSLEIPQTNMDGLIDQFATILNAVLAALNRKQNSLTKAIVLEEDEKKAIRLMDAVVVTIDSYNEAIDTANRKIVEYQQLVETTNIADLEAKLKELKIRKQRYEPDVVAAYQNLDAAIVAKNKAQAEKTKANESLKSESQLVFNSFGAKINAILQKFGVDYKVENEGVNLKGGSASGQLGISIVANGVTERINCSSDAAANPACMSLFNTLSGGDCSSLAFAFFLAQLEMDPNLGDAIVVVDDPYHDQDRSRQSQTIELLKQTANDCSQFFLLSHNLEFAQMFLSQKGMARNQIRSYIIEPLVSPVELRNGDLPPFASKVYEADYRELLDYVKNSNFHHAHLLEVVERIRPLLETYFQYKFPTAWTDNDWLGDMIEKIRNAASNESICTCKCLVKDLSEINDYTKRFHHRTQGVSADIPDPIELRQYVLRTLEVIHHA